MVRRKKPSVFLPRDSAARRAALTEALRRAAELAGGGKITIAEYDSLARKHGLPSAMAVRLFFGTWRAALAAVEGQLGLPASRSGAAAALDEGAACVAGTAEEALRQPGQFKTVTQFYLSVAVQVAQKGVRLRGKKICGYDAVPRVLESVRPDFLARVREEVKTDPGAMRGESFRYLQKLRQWGCISDFDLRRHERPLKGIMVAACLSTGSRPDAVQRAWRRLRLEAGIDGPSPEKIAELQRECAALRQRLERLERQLEVACRAR